MVIKRKIKINCFFFCFRIKNVRQEINMHTTTIILLGTQKEREQ